MPDRYQDEIEEILRKAGEIPPAKPGQQREDDRGASAVGASGPSPQPADNYKGRWLRFSPGKLMLAGLVIFVIGALTWQPAIWIGLAILVASYLLFFVKPRSMSIEKRWRGQVIEEYQSPWDRFKGWLKR